MDFNKLYFGYDLLWRINNTDGYPKSFQLQFSTFVPSGDESPIFMFNGLKGKSWVDIYFAPLITNNTQKENFYSQLVKVEYHPLLHIKRKGVLVLTLGDELPEIELNVATKVSYEAQSRGVSKLTQAAIPYKY